MRSSQNSESSAVGTNKGYKEYQLENENNSSLKFDLED